MGEDRVHVRRLGLVGVGAWGQRYIETVRRRPDCEFKAFARSSSRTDVDIPGALACANWQEVLRLGERGDLDGMIVATSPDNQAEIASAATQAGVPVLVEKPLGLSRAVTEGVLQCQRTSGRYSPVVVNYVHLFAPAYLALKSLVNDELAGRGKVVAIESVGCGSGPFRSTSALYDYGCHDVAMCLDLLGTASPLFIHLARRLPPGSGVRGELVDAEFDLAGIKVRLTTGNGASHKARRFAVSLANGRQIVYDDGQPHPDKLKVNGDSVPVSRTPPLDAALSFFLDLGARGSSEPVDTRHSAASLAFSVEVTGILDLLAAAVRE